MRNVRIGIWKQGTYQDGDSVIKVRPHQGTLNHP